MGLFGLALATVASQPWVMFTMQALFRVAAVAFTFMAVSLVLVRKSERIGQAPWFQWTQLLFDTLLVTTLVWLSDGPRSPYFVLLFMNIIASAWFLPAWGPVVVAGLNVTALGLTTLAGVLGFTQWVMPQSGAALYTDLTLRIFALFLVGMLSGLLADKLKSARRELAATVHAAEALQAEHLVVLNQLETGVLIVDQAGIIRTVNPAGVGLLGLVLGKPLNEVLTPRKEQWEQDFEIDARLQRLICRRSALGEGGEVVVVEDVTQLRHMEEVVEREERLAAVGRLAAGLAHEIRNPLASLSGSVQLLQDEDASPLHAIVLREVEHINGLVEDFLDIARPLQLRRVPTDVVAIVEDVATAFGQDQRYKDKCEVTLDLADVPLALLDGSRVRQIVWNLLLNAAQATPDYGRIKVSVALDEDALIIRISDEGVGISRDRLGRIFDPFYTTRSGGTGLGLANVERIVRAHGGAVSVSSTEGVGTIFSLSFPTVQARGSSAGATLG
jgi:two-component system sensor histidine kinase PilS (NtrC family)